VARLWSLLERLAPVVGMLRARCKDALLFLYLDSAFAMHFDNNVSTHKMCSNKIITMNANGTVI